MIMVMRESELRQLACRYDDHLVESGVSDLELWQQEIRGYARNREVAKAPSLNRSFSRGAGNRV
jgi:hypothetical protein